MNKHFAVVATCSLLFFSALSFGTPVKAQPVPVVLDQVAYHSRLYCFYSDGWRGPGWYWCGYAFRRGYGWGGPDGWRGFRHGHGGARRGRRVSLAATAAGHATLAAQVIEKAIERVRML